MILVERYLIIVDKFEEMKAIGGTDDVSINMLSQETKVNRHTTKKVILCHEAGIGYEGMDLGKFRHSKIGDRLNLDLNDESYLLWLRFDNPFRPNKEYVVKMYEDRGVMMSEATVSRWFNHYFDKRGSKMESNVVLVDKF